MQANLFQRMKHLDFYTTLIRLYSANSLKFSVLTGGGRSHFLSFCKSTSSPSHRAHAPRGGFFVSALVAVMLAFVLSSCTKERAGVREKEAGTVYQGFTVDFMKECFMQTDKGAENKKEYFVKDELILQQKAAILVAFLCFCRRNRK